MSNASVEDVDDHPAAGLSPAKSAGFATKSEFRTDYKGKIIRHP